MIVKNPHRIRVSASGLPQKTSPVPQRQRQHRTGDRRMTTASTPTDLARPPRRPASASSPSPATARRRLPQLARDLPEAHICTAAKFAQAFDGLPNPVRAYEGALRDEMAPLFAGYDQLVFFVSLGAVVRLIAPVLKSKDEDPA